MAVADGVDAATIAVGRPAPDFELRDQHGQRQALSSRRGDRNVLLVFYPWAFTGVCGGEMRVLHAKAQEFADRATDVLAISCDAVPSLGVFAEQLGVEVPLLSDFWPHGAVASAYGVFDADRGVAVRGSFLIDRDGVVRWTVRNEIPNARSLDDYLEAIDSLVS